MGKFLNLLTNYCVPVLVYLGCENSRKQLSQQILEISVKPEQSKSQFDSILEEISSSSCICLFVGLQPVWRYHPSPAFRFNFESLVEVSRPDFTAFLTICILLHPVTINYYLQCFFIESSRGTSQSSSRHSI